MGLFVWYFGTRGTRDMWRDVGHHTVVNGPRYKGLVDDIFINGHLADDMSLYVHRPSVTDPSVAPEGGDTFYALSPVPHLGFDNPVDWAAMAEPYRQKVQKVLEDQLLPGLGKHLTASEVFTPETFRTRYNSPWGTGFSVEPRIFQSAWFRPHNVSEEVPGLYIAGAGTHPGAGVPGVLCTAEVLDKLVPDPSAPAANRDRADGRRMTRAAQKAIAPADLEACREAIRHGSLSFHAASRLLPARVRDPSLALYAFCRLADDAVDLRCDKAGAVLSLRDRLELVYAGKPRNAPADRAFAAVVEATEMPRTLPEALLEGLAWDAMERRYDDFSGVCAYSARVAAAVGAMMCVIMGVRDSHALARACDMGVAMQLTNIARDIGEDARAGRIYLPRDWMAEVGLTEDALLAAPENPTEPGLTAQIRRLATRLLDEADALYRRGSAGIAALPADCRPGMLAARHIYAGIGAVLRREGCRPMVMRAWTTRTEKLGWLARAGGEAATTLVFPRSAVLYARPLAETAYLVAAAAHPVRAANPWGEGRAGALIAALAQLEARDRARRGLPGAGA
jgi:phytoene synthase